MKKLMIASAVAAVAVAGVASASISPFVRADLGYTTTHLVPADQGWKHTKPMVGTLAVGSDLADLGQQLKVGVELDGTYAFLHPSYEDGSDKSSVMHYSIDPMAYLAYKAMPKLTLEAKAGYGFQHAKLETNGVQLASGHHWAPVLAAELGYAVSDQLSVRLGDRYTFGRNYSTDAAYVQGFNDDPAHARSRSNVIYLGLQYNFG
jgi:opacity protein-like surface antigen